MMKKEKRELYQLIIGQLIQDGYNGLASDISQVTMVPIPTDTDSKPTLEQLVANPNRDEDEDDKDYQFSLSEGSNSKIKGLDYETEIHAPAPPRRYPNYATKFITTHKDECRCAKFNHDGRFVATASSDTSIKLLDVGLMKAYNANSHDEDLAPHRPVIRTFYDHEAPINDLDFHPGSPVLVSCSDDNTIKFFDFKKLSAKKAFRYLQDTHPVKTVNFHPSGDFVLAGTDHHMIRLYDVNTFQCYTTGQNTDHHLGGVTQVRYSPDGKMFASCSKDGIVKLWDSVSNSCIHNFLGAHGGLNVTCGTFTKNSKYLLTTGNDGTVKLWDVRQKRLLSEIFTQHSPRVLKEPLQACFSYNEDFIYTANEDPPFNLSIWDSRTGELVQKLAGHNNVVGWIASSNSENSFFSCSLDNRARFWIEEEI